MTKTFCILMSSLFFYGCQAVQDQPANILFIFIDDMGYGDLGSYGNAEVHTPNIDQLASEGIRFHQFYVNSPICSPSRVAVTTGQYPSRWGITSFIHTRQANANRGMKNHLALQAPSLPRELQKAGYYTAHIGKWHMGGGRDDGDAPLITEYGFNESVTQFEGLGERYLATYETLPQLKDSTRMLEKWSAALGRGPIHWEKRENFTKQFVDHAIRSIERAKSVHKPFYINLWPDDIHTPLEPPKELRGDLSTRARFLGVMHEMDRQMGRLFEYIKNDPSLAQNTLIIFTSDNGPDKEVNKAGHLRGYKTNLYEGGIRVPFIAWWPGKIPKEMEGTLNKRTVMAGIDLPVTFRAVAGIHPGEEGDLDGENMLPAISGATTPHRAGALSWLRPPDRPGYHGENDPDLAIRMGDFKLLMDVDGSNVQLYNVVKDEAESNDLAASNPAKVEELKQKLMDWYLDYPHQVDRSLYQGSE